MSAGTARIPGGVYVLGSDAHYAEERPAHRVSLDEFTIDLTPVTNAEYAAFVDDTDYVTIAERPLDPAEFPGAPAENLVPGSMVFTGTRGPVDLRHLSQWWLWTPGASWRHPEGQRSSIEERLDHPVVHVAHADALAFAAWAGKRLPSEAEWEAAARGGIEGGAYTWGDEPDTDDASPRSNHYRGDFPWRPLHGSGRTTPVGSFAPNGYGLFDMAGNVWEWTDDWYADRHRSDADKPCCLPHDPRGGEIEGSFDPQQPQFRVPRKVIKGGSFLCADSYCLRYRPAARRPQMIDTGMSHVGFRCVTLSERGGTVPVPV